MRSKVRGLFEPIIGIGRCFRLLRDRVGRFSRRSRWRLAFDGIEAGLDILLHPLQLLDRGGQFPVVALLGRDEIGDSAFDYAKTPIKLKIYLIA